MKDASTVGLPAELAERPLPAPPRPYRFPSFARGRLAGGLDVVIAPVHKLPVVTALLVCDAGAGAEPEGQDGVANLAARALLEGTTRLDGNALIERFERLGAAVSAGADWDASMVGMTVLRQRFEEAMPLFAEMVLQPAYPEREVERLKAERLADLMQLRTEPRGLADEMFARVLYQPGSRYSRPDDGDAGPVSSLTRADVERFHVERYRAGGSTLILAGDVTVEEGMAQAERVLGEWTGRAKPLPVPDASPGRTTRSVHLVPKAEAAQSELRVGHVGLPRSTPDYFPVLVMNAVLGGLFSSRVNLNLREAHGYTYGAFSHFSWRRGAGPFVVSSAVRSDVTADAAREVLLEIDRIRGERIRDDELSLATSYLGGVFPIRYETTDAIARALAALVTYELPMDYFDGYRDAVRAVTVDEVLRAAREHLHPELLQLVVVGDAAAVREPLAALGLGDVHEHQP